MSSIELTSSQQMILQELVDLYRESESAVKGEEIAEGVSRNLVQSSQRLSGTVAS